MKVLILFFMLCLVASVHLSSVEDEDLDENMILHSFAVWKKIYAKSYTHDEEKLRNKIFDERCKLIKEHNQRYKLGKETYVMGQNEYSDLTNEEFKEFMTIHRTEFSDFQIDGENKNDFSTNHRVKRQALPANFDWRSTGKVAGAQDQGSCGSGYAFAAISAIESQVAIACGQLYKLSEQQIVDCSGPQGNWNCTSGTPQLSYRYLISNVGVCSNANYPYTSGIGGDVGQCKYSSQEAFRKVKVTAFTNIAPGEANLLSALYNKGPITIGMDVDYDSFQNYASGIYSEPLCSNSTDSINHYMVVVGYGTNSAGQAFWSIKNSWSTSWGISGFIKVARNFNNMCCVACSPSIPTIDPQLCL